MGLRPARPELENKIARGEIVLGKMAACWAFLCRICMLLLTCGSSELEILNCLRGFHAFSDFDLKTFNFFNDL